MQYKSIRSEEIIQDVFILVYLIMQVMSNVARYN